MTTAASRPRKRKRAVTAIEDVTWLQGVREVRHPIDLTHPLLARQVHAKSGPPLPQPSVPFPEKHPYCELSFHFEGRLLQFIGAEKIERNAGSLMLIGPGTPHYAMRLSYPQHSITIHFLPILLFEMGPANDGARVLARFTAQQEIGSRAIQPPPALAREIGRRLKRMITEFQDRQTGSEFRLRALLLETLVDLLRWEDSAGIVPSKKFASANWGQIEKTLRYMHEHYSESLYVEQIAQAAGMSVSRLQGTFREALGMSCVHYLRALRISHAKALLCAPGARVTEIALEAGFQTLSHFNTSFRNFIGMSPTEYVRSHQRKSS